MIIGSVGNVGIKAKLIGNTAEKIMRLLKTELLILYQHIPTLYFDRFLLNGKVLYRRLQSNAHDL